METNMMKIRRLALSASLATAATLTGGCATVGYEFPSMGVTQLQVGVTTQSQAKQLFGNPWRVGWEDGKRTWTYGQYNYYLFAPAKTRDLVLRFNPQGILQSYSYNTTETEE